MLTSMNEFKFFKSFRIPVESGDEIRFLIEFQDEYGRYQNVNDIQLHDVSISGLAFSSTEKVSTGQQVRVSLSFKRLRYDLEGRIVRAFGEGTEGNSMLYGVELDEEEHTNMRRIVEQYITSFSPDRARDCITRLALSERYADASEGLEVFSLMLSLFKDITSFGNKEAFVESMLEEVVRILNAQRASIFLINAETNELEAVAALGIDKSLLHFDYRKGIAGSVFTTGVSLNIDTQTDKIRYTKEVDSKTGFHTRSILCHPITNRDDKVIGVIEILNKRNEQRFTVEDEKTMKVLSLIFSSVFHNFNPISEKSLIRRFSTPYDREFAYIGRSPGTNEARRGIVRLKDIDSPLLVRGENGVGKKLLARIIHNEGKRGLNQFECVKCKGVDTEDLAVILFGDKEHISVLEKCAGGTVLIDEISYMPLAFQTRLFNILQDKRIEERAVSLDIRLIFTCSQDLDLLVSQGNFNPDLLHLISESVFDISPLRKRTQDIDDLLSYFLRKECRKQGLLLKEFSDKLKEELKTYEWPKNVLELQEVVAKAVLYNPKAHIIEKLQDGSTPIIDMTKQSLAGLDEIPHAKNSDLPLKERMAVIEREIILAEIKRHKGNKSQAAKSMGISREALRKKLLISEEVLLKSDKGAA